MTLRRPPAAFSGPVLALAAAALLILGPNLLLPQPQLSPNDLHLLWLVSPERRFVGLESRGRTVLHLHPDLAFDLRHGIEAFPKEKAPDVFRVFCVGGSTTRGWPFAEFASYPRVLALQLADLHPGRKIEVINAGIMGSDSSSDLSLVRELLGYAPDLIVLYEGRNEAFSAALHRGVRGLALRAHCRLLRASRLYAWLKTRWFGGFREPFDHAAAARRWAGAGVPPDGLRRRLRGNLRAMAEAGARRSVPVALLTQVLSPQERERGELMSDVNSWLRELAAEDGLPLIDVDAAFLAREGSGARLILPVSVHPDLAGYALLAGAVARGLEAAGLLDGSEAGRSRGRLKSDLEYLRALGVTAAPLAQVYARLEKLFETLGEAGEASRCGALARELGRRGPADQVLRASDLGFSPAGARAATSPR